MFRMGGGGSETCVRTSFPGSYARNICVWRVFSAESPETCVSGLFFVSLETEPMSPSRFSGKGLKTWSLNPEPNNWSLKSSTLNPEPDN